MSNDVNDTNAGNSCRIPSRHINVTIVTRVTELQHNVAATKCITCHISSYSVNVKMSFNMVVLRLMF